MRITGEGKLLTRGFARYSARYVVSDEVGEIRGVFTFYLPAYLIADVDGLLQRADPVYHLTHGLYGESMGQRINPRRYGERTWSDFARYKHSMFEEKEVAAIISYLEFKARTVVPAFRDAIKQALRNYWRSRRPRR